MRPSQYHYIKRIWTRNAYRKKNNGCLGGIADKRVGEEKSITQDHKECIWPTIRIIRNVCARSAH